MKNIFNNRSFDNHEQIIHCFDEYTGLKAIIAIHNTNLGPSLGGCRMYPYASEDDALTDVLRLSRGMTYKSAISGMNFGGGKSVIIGDPKKLASESFFRTFGRFVNSLNGRYITAEDVGTSVSLMEWTRIETPHVVGLPTYLGGLGDPSPVTAHGVFVGINASLHKLTGSDSLENKRVAVQGVGHVGYHLCKELCQAGATVYVTDVNKDALAAVAKDLKVTVVAPNEIYGLDVDIFAPCAMGAIINPDTIPQLKCAIIAGATNNQLADEKRDAKALKQRNILYAPDYAINAGGLINVSAEYFEAGSELAWSKTHEIYDIALKIFEVADAQDITSLEAANHIAEKRIKDISMCKTIYAKYGKGKR